MRQRHSVTINDGRPGACGTSSKHKIGRAGQKRISKERRPQPNPEREIEEDEPHAGQDPETHPRRVLIQGALSKRPRNLFSAADHAVSMGTVRAFAMP